MVTGDGVDVQCQLDDDEFEVRISGGLRAQRVHLHLLRVLLRTDAARDYHRSGWEHGSHQVSDVNPF